MSQTQLKADQLSPWQSRAMGVPETFDLFLGGGKGGGKSRLLAAMFLRHTEQYGSRARCLVIRRSFPGLTDMESELRQYFHEVFGDDHYNGQKHLFSLPNGGTVQLDQLEGEPDKLKFAGKSYTHIAVDEVGQYPNPTLVDGLRASLRAPSGVPTRVILLGNPGGVGHSWAAKRHALQQSWVPYTEPATGAQFVTIASTFRDNIFIDREKYAANLRAACSNDPELAAAWLDGDWTVIRGSYFASVLDEYRNMFEPWPHLPDSLDCPPGHFRIGRDPEWRIFLSHDWGMSAQSLTFLCVESPGAEVFGKFYPRGSILLLDELTTADSNDPTRGLGLTVPEVAARIKSMCDQWGVAPEGVADDAIFSKTGAEAGSIADEFRRAGVIFTRARKGSRVAGW